MAFPYFCAAAFLRPAAVFQLAGTYRVCYRLGGPYGTYATVGDPLTVSAGAFTGLQLYNDSKVFVTSGDTFLLHLRLTATSTVTATLSFGQGTPPRSNGRQEGDHVFFRTLSAFQFAGK